MDSYPGHVPTAAPEGKGRNRVPFNWETPELLRSTELLETALAVYQPDIIVPLGNMALRYFKRDSHSIDDERGAPFRDSKGRLCLATYHPRDLFMRYELTALAQFDIGKAKRLAKEGWQPPEFNIRCLPTYSEVVSMLSKFIERKAYLAMDIETHYKLKNEELNGKMTCVGMAYSNKDAFVIPFVDAKGANKPYWPKHEEVQIWKLLNTCFRTCPMVGHNCMHFDGPMVGKHHGIQCNFIDDTMFAHWSCYPEMSKSLAFCSSLYTDNPYWKDELKDSRSGRIARWKEFEYNGRDCIITMQVAMAIGKELKEKGKGVRDHYKFNIRTSRAYEYMAARGAYIDTDKLNARVMELSGKAEYLSETLSEAVGKPLNVRSPQQVKHYLYKELGLPERTKLVKNTDGTTESRTTADYLTTLYLARQFPDEPTIEAIGTLRKLHKRISALQKIKFDKNKICRWAFSVVGTETGRSSGKIPNDGIGIQPQNVDRRDRDLFLPPEGHWWMKADLEGADSVTVAACLEALGDPRLHEDLKAGIKPAQTLGIALALRDNRVMSWSQDEIKAKLGVLKESEEGKRYYRVAKVINHGSAYMLSPAGMHSQMFRQSEGELFIQPSECEAMQNLLFARYDYPRYHKQIKTLMNSEGILKCASGQERFFFGRRDNATLRKMLAYMPQANTAYVTNMVIHRLYHDPRNRDGVDLWLKLCNQVHDETDGYIPKGGEQRAHDLFYDVCHVPLEVWGVPFEIVFEAQYGESWGSQPNDL
jgi:hypothetical protein